MDPSSSDSTETEFTKRETRRLERERSKIQPINMFGGASESATTFDFFVNMKVTLRFHIHIIGSTNKKDSLADVDPMEIDPKFFFFFFLLLLLLLLLLLPPSSSFFFYCCCCCCCCCCCLSASPTHLLKQSAPLRIKNAT